MSIAYVKNLREAYQLYINYTGYTTGFFMGVDFTVMYHQWEGEPEAPHNCPTWTGNFFTGECKCMLAPEDQ